MTRLIHIFDTQDSAVNNLRWQKKQWVDSASNSLSVLKRESSWSVCCKCGTLLSLFADKNKHSEVSFHQSKYQRKAGMPKEYYEMYIISGCLHDALHYHFILDNHYSDIFWIVTVAGSYYEYYYICNLPKGSDWSFFYW